MVLLLVLSGGEEREREGERDILHICIDFSGSCNRRPGDRLSVVKREMQIRCEYSHH